MIIIGIFIAMMLLGFVIMKRNIGEDSNIFGWALVLFGSIFLILALIIMIWFHATADRCIQKNKIQYEGLCKRYQIIKSDYEDVSKSDVIADITAWNTEVYDIKYWTENPWTNWFNPRKIADNMYYISLNEESGE